MTFITILIALIIERFFHWSHLRHWQWFARYQRFLSVRFAGWPSYLLLIVCIVPPVLIIAVIGSLLSHGWYEIPKMIFGIIVLVYCMGPDNLWVQIYSCIRALNKEDTEKAIEEVKTAFRLPSVNQPQEFHLAFARAIFIAANQRIFVVLFWFVLLGPWSVVLYRLASLCADNAMLGVTHASLRIKQVFDWLPARLFSFLFALGGNFTRVFTSWKRSAVMGLNSSDILLGECGIAALDVVQDGVVPIDGSAENEALLLLDRVFIIGLVV